MQRDHQKLIYFGQSSDEEIFDFDGCNIAIYEWPSGRQLLSVSYDIGIKFVADSKPYQEGATHNVRIVATPIAKQINGLLGHDLVNSTTRLVFVSQSKPWVRP